MKAREKTWRLRIAVLTCLALTAFAANSILCRLALGGAQIDAAGYTGIRLISGAVVLWLLSALRRRSCRVGGEGDWVSAGMLFTYAFCFSFAYVSLSAGTGALILFAAVQITMLTSAFLKGERLHPRQWAGICLALAGLTYLVLPGLTAPDPAGAALMAAAGVAWGIYSLRGRRTDDPIGSTAGNFIRSVPPVVIAALLAQRGLHFSPPGVLLAVGSGALASGLGYAMWYAALTGLSASRAATVQLSVPVLAAAGGILFHSEEPSARLVVAATVILGGVAMALFDRRN